MGKTIRNIKKGTTMTEGGDAQARKYHGTVNYSRKMKPYSREQFKFTADKTDHVPGNAKGVSQYDKLVTKNANRGMKKAYRQQLKKELAEDLELLTL